MREELPFPDKVLQTLHNLCATAADLARKGEEVSRILQHNQSETFLININRKDSLRVLQIMMEKSDTISTQEELLRSVLFSRSEYNCKS